MKCAGQLTKEEAAKIVQKLEDTCLKLDFDSEVGLTKDTVDATFAESDGQNNSFTHSINQPTNQLSNHSFTS